jgi:exodeoxyribonuclease VII small subunit
MSEIDAILAEFNQPVEELTYEQAFAQLEKIVSTLESNEHSLDASIGLYERGQMLASYCARLLDQAVLKIQQLSGEDVTDYRPEE